MRLTAPELAAAYRPGMCAEGATVLDAGEVGTEMLYYLVGSRDLDGGLMCTASHNPKALHRRQARPARGDRAVGRRRDRRRAGQDRSRPRPRPRRRLGGARRAVRGVPGRALKFIEPGRVKPLNVVVDGGNGMAGPMVGPLLRAARARPDRTPTGSPTATFPTTSPTRCLPENREFIMQRGGAARRRTSGSPGTATPTAASSSTTTGAFVDGDFLTALLAESMLSGTRARPPRRSCTTSARAGRCADVAERGGGEALINRVGHAFFKTRMREENASVRRRGIGPLLLPRLLLRGLGDDPGAADPRAALRAGRGCPSCSSPTARATSSPARSTPRWPTRTAKMEELASRY